MSPSAAALLYFARAAKRILKVSVLHAFVRPVPYISFRRSCVECCRSQIDRSIEGMLIFPRKVQNIFHKLRKNTSLQKPSFPPLLPSPSMIEISWECVSDTPRVCPSLRQNHNVIMPIDQDPPDMFTVLRYKHMDSLDANRCHLSTSTLHYFSKMHVVEGRRQSHLHIYFSL